MIRETTILWCFNNLQCILDWHISLCFVFRWSLALRKKSFCLQECIHFRIALYQPEVFV